MGLHDDAVVVDAHHDLLLLVVRDHRAGVTDTFGARWLPELRAGGVDVQVLPIYLEEEFLPEGALRRTLQIIDALHVEVAAHPDDVVLCLDPADLDAAVGTGRLALVLALEGAEGVGSDLGMVRILHRLGMRMMSFTWNRRTMLADGTAESDTAGRLTSLGIEVLRLAEALGVVVDVTHASDAGTWQLLELATRPMVASHSSCRALCGHPRNLTDDQLRAIAAGGGVVGINLHPALIDPDDPSISRCVDHIVHAIETAGEDHVGLGPDFCKDYFDQVNPTISQVLVDRDTLFATVKDLAGPPDLPRLTAAMVGRGLPEPTIRKVLGENFLRVLRAGLAPAG